MRVVQRQPVQVDVDAETVQQTLRALQDGQRRQTEKIELHQARLLHMLHGVLRDQEFRARIAIQRHQFYQRPITDHHAGRMRGRMPVQSLDLKRDFEQPA